MPELRPQLAEILRTCVYPPSLILKIEYIEYLDIEPAKNGPLLRENDPAVPVIEVERRYAVKLLLSDGAFMMQALLHRKLAVLRDVTNVAIGDLLNIRKFAVKRCRRSNGQGHITYLAVEDCHFLQQVQPKSNPAVAEKIPIPEQAQNGPGGKRSRSQGPESTPSSGKKPRLQAEDLPGGFCRPISSIPPAGQMGKEMVTGIMNTESAESSKEKQPGSDTPHPVLRSPRATAHVDVTTPAKSQTLTVIETSKRGGARGVLTSTFGARQIMNEDEDGDDEFFETFSTNREIVQSRRSILQRLWENASFATQTSTPERDADPQDREATVTGSAFTVVQPKAHLLRRISSPASVIDTDNQMLAPPVHQTKSVRDGTLLLSQTPTSYLPTPLQPDTRHQAAQRQILNQPAPPTPHLPTLLPNPPFHTLASLRSPPASQPLPLKSYTLTTLAIISWTGTTTIHRPGSLFPPKRHLKIVDPSLSTSRPPSSRQPTIPPSKSGPGPEPSSDGNPMASFRGQNSFQDAVTVAVYIDANNFKPPAGMLVLFRGLVMQRLGNGDIILNAYGRLKEQRFEDGIGASTEHADLNGNGNGNVNVNDGQHQMQDVPPGDNGTLNDASTSNADTHWFITDHTKIRALGHGSRLDYYLEWWAEKQRSNQAAQS